MKRAYLLINTTNQMKRTCEFQPADEANKRNLV